jgi:putative transcriptional regulator
MIKNHPSPELLTDYARGALRDGAMLVVACHLDVCATCRSEAALWEQVGGALLENAEPVALSDGALERAMALLDRQARSDRAQHAPRFLQQFDIPSALAGKRVGFRRWVTPGIWFAPVRTAGTSSSPTYLVFADRNVTLPLHTHGGRELTLILHGSFSDSTGTYAPGDFVETDETIHHAPSVTTDSACLCLAHSDTTMHLAGRSARLLQSLLGGLY